LLDIILWLLVILHVEGATVPADFADRHALAFSFPWSHSLAGAVVWAATAAFVWTWSGGEGRYFAFAPAVIGVTVFSHWLLDVLVHPAEMPLWPGAPAIGIGLMQPTALFVELALAALGFALFLLRSRLSLARRALVGGLTLGVAGLSIFGATSATPPGDLLNFAGLSLLVLFTIVTIAAIADRKAS
jgi:hypothetical protein